MTAMLKYRTLGSIADDQLARLLEQLARRGAMSSTDSNVDLYLVAADSVASAADALESLEPSARSRALLIGVPGKLDIRQPPSEGSLGWVLENYRPIGAISIAAQWRPELAGFIGPKNLAERMGAGYAKQFSSRHYGTWFRCEGEDAADFLMRVIASMSSNVE